MNFDWYSMNQSIIFIFYEISGDFIIYLRSNLLKTEMSMLLTYYFDLFVYKYAEQNPEKF